MKKPIIATFLLLSSISTFAQDSRSRTTGQIRAVQPNKISNMFSILDVTTGSMLGKCQVVVIGKIGKAGAPGAQFALQLNNAFLIVERDAQLHISTDGSSRVLIAESEADEEGKVKQLRFGWGGSLESSAVTELSILTKQYNVRGQVRYVANESIDCAR